MNSREDLVVTSSDSKWLERNALVAYFALAYAITWTVALLLAASYRGWLGLQLPSSAHYLTSYGPLLAAFLVTALTGGAAGVRELVGRMTRWRVGPRWLLFALFSPAALFLVSAVILRAWSDAWPDWRRFGQVAELPSLGWLGGWVFHTLTFGIGEETGWRGFALPRLQRSRSALSATLVLSVFWALWHVPMFLYKEDYQAMGIGGSIAFFLGMLAGAIVFTWLYNSTGGSVLVVALWHGAYNAAVASAEGLVPAMVTAAVVFLAVRAVRVHGLDTLSRLSKHTI